VIAQTNRLIKRQAQIRAGTLERSDLPAYALTICSALSIIIVTALLVYTLWVDSRLSREKFGWHSLFDRNWDPVQELFGALPYIYGTVITSLLALLIAVPTGVGAAIFLAELAPAKLSDAMTFLIELLAAVPSVIFGVVGIFVLVSLMKGIVPTIKEVLGFLPLFQGPFYGVSVLTASVVLSIMIVPFIISISREALLAVPMAQREGSAAVGATKWETTWHVVVPYASKAITGSIFLALARALGETMAVTMVIGKQPEHQRFAACPGVFDRRRNRQRVRRGDERNSCKRSGRAWTGALRGDFHNQRNRSFSRLGNRHTPVERLTDCAQAQACEYRDVFAHRHLRQPAAEVWSRLPEQMRQSLANAFYNLAMPRRFVNKVLQLRLPGAGIELTRFVINTTAGVAGLFDVASRLGLEKSDADTGETFAVYGVKPGPYLVLPLLPPLTVRDTFGFAADSFMDPLSWFVTPIGADFGRAAAQRINERANNMKLYDDVEDTSIDLYAAVRNGYLQRRRKAIQDAIRDQDRTRESIFHSFEPQDQSRPQLTE